uniref:Uncharacterized protein n=1 Tax=Anguilla anguilla TaxID=7936 RepID=A0A0E9Q9Y8_ANGAN
MAPPTRIARDSTVFLSSNCSTLRSSSGGCVLHHVTIQQQHH